MGRKSTRENKTIYQIYREEAELTRAEASEKMTAISEAKIEKMESQAQKPSPYEIVQMAEAYKKPDLCNYYCSNCCEIGKKYIPQIHVDSLSGVILETIASLDDVNAMTSRLVQIARDGKISKEEIHDFAMISNKLDEISLSIDALNLWVEQTALQGDIDMDELQKEKKAVH